MQNLCNIEKINNIVASSLGSKTFVEKTVVIKEKGTNTDSNSRIQDDRKILGTLVASRLWVRTLAKETVKQVTNVNPKLPGSTSMKPVNKEDAQGNKTIADTSGAKGQQMLKIYKKKISKKSTTGSQEHWDINKKYSY